MGGSSSAASDLIAGNIEQTYGRALVPVNLSEEKLNVVKKLLGERTVARLSAEQAMPKRLPIEEQKAFRARAEAGVDQKIEVEVGPAAWEKIKDLIFVQNELALIELNYAPAMLQADEPLDGLQTVALAKVFKRTYSDVDNALTATTDFAAIRAAKSPDDRARAQAPLIASRAYRTREVDRTGLSAPDREVMQQAAEVLSSSQLAILQKKLAEVTRGFLRRAVEKSP